MSLKNHNFSLGSFVLGASSTVVVLVGAVTFLHHGFAFAQHVEQLHGAASPAANEEVTHVRAGVASLGKQWNANVREETAKLYAPLAKAHNDASIKRTSDVSYGSDAKQKLDLFVPSQGFNQLGPVFVYFHEGSDKIVKGYEELFYSNVGKGIARMGGVGINANYRMSADGKTSAEDVRLVLEWARKNVAQYGGDPQGMLAIGDSDGATLIASYLFNEKAQLEGGPGIAGAILGSGTFASLPSSLVDNYNGKAVPILMWSADLEPVQSGVNELKDKLCQKYGSCPMFAELSGHNHVSPVMSLDTSDTSVFTHIVRFYHTAVRK